MRSMIATIREGAHAFRESFRNDHIPWEFDSWVDTISTLEFLDVASDSEEANWWLAAQNPDLEWWKPAEPRVYKVKPALLPPFIDEEDDEFFEEAEVPASPPTPKPRKHKHRNLLRFFKKARKPLPDRMTAERQVHEPDCVEKYGTPQWLVRLILRDEAVMERKFFNGKENEKRDSALVAYRDKIIGDFCHQNATNAGVFICESGKFRRSASSSSSGYVQHMFKPVS